MKKHKCPVCNGCGEIEKVSNARDRKYLAEKKQKAIKLRELGFTYSEIMKALDYKSPRSVAIQLGK